MSHSEYPVSTVTYQSPEELRAKYLQGQPYNNIIVSTPQPEFSDAYDREVQIAVEAVTMYWPGGTPEMTGRNFETLTLHREGGDTVSDTETAAKVICIRDALLGASVGEAALSRVPAEAKAYWERIKLLQPAPILFAEAQCSLRALPLALCETSRVTESHIVPVGTRIMNLWYPNYLSPKPVLYKLKRVIRNIMEQEVITDDSPPTHE